MKTVVKLLVLIFVMNVASLVCANKACAQEMVNNQVFYDELSPYGEWIQSPNYGYVWVPNAGPGFSPYQTAGHWSFTNCGWTWVSDYPWGWAPFHYGRWDMDPNFGWYWVPGHEWGPAWVTWRQCEGYYGWAPIAPGISIEYAYGNAYYPPQERWVFVNQRYINDPYVYNYYAPRGNNMLYINRTSVIYNRYDDRDRGSYYNQGPRVDEVERYTNRRVDRVEIFNNDRPGQRSNGNSLAMYRPVVNRNSDERADRPVPRKITSRNEIKPEHERSNASQNIINGRSMPNNSGEINPNRGQNQLNNPGNKTSVPNSGRNNFEPSQSGKPNQTHPGNNQIKSEPVNQPKPSPNNIRTGSPVNSEKGKAAEPERKTEGEQRNPR